MSETIDIAHVPFRKRVAVRLILPTLVLVASLVSVVALLMWYSYRADNEAANRVPADIAETIAETTLAFFEVQELNVTLASRSVPGAVVGEKERLFLSDIVRNDTAIAEIVVFDLQGAVIHRATESTSAPILDADSPVVETSRERVALTRQSDVTSPLTSNYGTPYVVWTSPIINPDGTIAGLLSAAIDVSILWQFITDPLPEGGAAYAYIANVDGSVLVSSRVIDESVSVEKVRDTLFSISDAPSVERYHGLFGAHVAGKLERLIPTEWVVVVEVPLVDLMSATQRNLIILGALFFVILLIAFYAFYSFRFHLTRPLRILSQGVALLGAGDYHTRITLPVQNELSVLADVMNAMAGNIESRTSEIVVRLKRTIADLDRSAKALMKRDEDLSRANERLERLDHAKSEFVSIAAHQLRTPLSALKWAQQMLLDQEAGPITEAQRTLLLQSHESVRRMVTLVNDLLSADHLEYGKVTYNFGPVDSLEVISSAIGELSPMAAEHAITIDYVPDKTGGQLSADPERLKEVFLNLLSNAIKYTPNNGQVTVRVMYGMGKVIYTIADTGIGIPESEKARLFEKFVRMENAKKVDANGSGLGLFIAKKIVDAHNGRIWFDSVEGKGTTFFVELPLSVGSSPTSF